MCIQDTSLPLKDETIKVFLNPYGTLDDVDEELKNFLKYVADGIPVDDFTRELESEVALARINKGWEAEYMTLMMKEREKYNEGLQQGEALLGALIKKLFADGRSQDVELVASDENARKQFYREYGLVE